MQMPGPNGVPINVHLNFKDISYDSTTQQWTIPAGTPRWDVPPSVPVPPGNNLLTWNLIPSHVPDGFEAAFDPAFGIAFSAGWPGGQPDMVDDETIQCTDDFDTSHGSPSYYYSITVNLAQTDGSASHAFTLDPDIKNKGAGPIILHVPVGAGAGVAVTAE
jgi:hypothetical protein